ncbi:helix-turn-helix domain-containing protein [Clostridium sp. YIM B02505]|uniref:Helix-turn-helix domain-containing protein n=1 Tax=Clostridium yunnanense TaxID=2800325 RepID=A0ABS1ES57_9CLOT|nr:helix-turn-helix transcriptional regulator [Clostridium yunnanense]MBK1812236.1 helix-turn-helix domain-containing protein [Clostridium yunnanense]
MDKLKLGETIFQLRKARNITQEQLAAILGVSAGAISKWENGNSTPDISLLAPLARALKTSIDELLSFQLELSETEVTNIKQELVKVFLHEGYSAGEEKCLIYLNEYSNSIYLKLELAALLYMYLITAENPTEEFIKSKKLYSLSILQQVVESRDPKYTPIALFSMAQLQMDMGNYEESEKSLNELPLHPIDPVVLYTRLYLQQGKNEEAIKCCSNKLLNYIIYSCTMLSALVKVSRNAKDYDKAKFYLGTWYKLQKMFQIGLGSAAGNYSKLYIETNELEAAARWFKTYVKEYISAKYDHSSNQYFEKIKLQANPEDQKIIRKKALQSIIDDKEFKVLDGVADYEEGIRELKTAVENM